MNYELLIDQSLPLIQECITKQQENEITKELQEKIEEIQNKHNNNNFNELYEVLRCLLRPLQEQLSLQIKRILNISTLDNYTTFISSRHFQSINDFINLELSTSKYNGNMTKFFYNPIPLTSETRKFFSHIQTLFVYSREDNQFENDTKIIKREIQFIPYYLQSNEKKQIEEWTRMKCSEILFDSDRNDWNQNSSVFNECIEGKKNIIFIVEDKENNKYGYYFNGTIIEEQYDEWMKSSDSFLFSLKSNGRIDKMIQVKEKQFAEGFKLYDKSHFVLFGIDWGFWIFKEKYKSKSRIWEHSEYFDYQEFTKVFHSHLSNESFENINIERFFVIQMV